MEGGEGEGEGEGRGREKRGERASWMGVRSKALLTRIDALPPHHLL